MFYVCGPKRLPCASARKQGVRRTRGKRRIHDCRESESSPKVICNFFPKPSAIRTGEGGRGHFTPRCLSLFSISAYVAIILFPRRSSGSLGQRASRHVTRIANRHKPIRAHRRAQADGTATAARCASSTRSHSSTRRMAAMAHSICPSSGSRVVRYCICRPGHRMTLTSGFSG